MGGREACKVNDCPQRVRVDRIFNSKKKINNGAGALTNLALFQARPVQRRSDQQEKKTINSFADWSPSQEAWAVARRKAKGNADSDSEKQKKLTSSFVPLAGGRR